MYIPSVNYNHWMIIILAAGFLLSCTTTTVHVNTHYLNASSASALKQKLSSIGFDVKLNEHPFPSGISHTSIVVSPFIYDEKALPKLEFALQQLGYEINEANSLVNSNHWYTKNTMGLYIVPTGVNAHEGKSMVDLAFTYQSSECSYHDNLVMKKNGKFSYGSGQNQVTGNWSITEFPYILFENKAPYIYAYFEVNREKIQDNIGPLNLITLAPLSPSSFGDSCTFIYGVRE